MKTIFFNSTIYTMDKYNKNAEAILIEDEIIRKVGTNQEILALRDSTTEIIDCKGQTMIPGFNDSHMHLYSFGVSLEMINLDDCTSIEDCICKAKEHIKKFPVSKGSWIRGRGWNQDYFRDEKRFLTRYDLDQISKEVPIIMTRACGHVAVANSKALSICNIKKNPPQVKGGQIDIDKEGIPTGVFRENALDIIYQKIPNPTIDEIKQTLIHAMNVANKMGITSIQTDDLSHLPNKDYKLMLKAYEELCEEGKLTCRIYQQSLLSKERLDEFLSQGYTTGTGNEYFKIGPLKILSDGSLGARTAALNEYYHDDPTNKGIMCYTDNELLTLIETAHKNNMQVAVHCIGDRAMYKTFNIYEKVLKENPRDDHRHSIIHCQITDEYILDKFKELNILALVQPIFLHYDIHIVEKRVGPKLAKTSYAFNTMLNKGIHVAYGTDCPVEIINPFPNIQCAVTRRDLNGYPQEGFNEHEKVTIEDAIYQYTLGSAFASFEEKIKGSITEGKLADLTIIDKDIFSMLDISKIKDIKVNMTIVGGKIVYKK